MRLALLTFGDLDYEPGGIGPGGRDGSLESGTESASIGRRSGNIDRKIDVQSDKFISLPDRELLTCRREHPVVKSANQPVLFCERNEVGCGNDAQGGMGESDECLESSKSLALQIYERLVVELQPSVFDRHFQLVAHHGY